MSLQEAVPTIDELREAGIHELIAISGKPTCWHYANVLLDPSTLPAASTPEWRARTLIGFVASLRLKSDADVEPLAISTWFGALGPVALTKDQLTVLAAWMPEVSDSELRARIADVLWIAHRPRSHLHGRAAVAAYLDSAERHLVPDGHWPHAVDAIERALSLPASFRLSDFVPRVESILDGKFGAAEGPRDARLMEVMLNHRIGNALKYGPQAEAEAEALEKRAETETYATNISLMFAREFWTAAAGWRARTLSAGAPQVQAAKLRAAETYVKEANKARNANQPLVEAHFLGNAITTLRRAGADRAQTDALVTRMMASQRSAPSDAVTVPLDLTEQAESGRRAVENKSLREAILSLAMVAQVPAIATLRDMANNYLSKSLVARVFPAVLSSSDARVVAHMPSVSFGDDGEAKSEAVLRWHMWHQAGWVRLMSCGRIMGALDQLELEHNPRISDLLPLVNASSLVPPGHEGLFAKGLHAGLQGDFMVAIHILIPQLENGLRWFIEDVLGKTMVSHDEDGTQTVNLMKRVLSHPELAKVLGDDLLFDLQGLLIAQEASNLRNMMSHGMLADRDIGFDAIYAWWLCLRLCMLLMPAPSQPNEAMPQGAISPA